MEKIISFYNEYDEESRITTNKARKIEFITTTQVLNDYVRSDNKILELGAGTGVYSFYFAEKGHEVYATDLTPKHVEIMREKLQKYDDKIKIYPEIVNAIDLSKYEDNIFDVVLCLGPMYHLTNEEDRKQCLNECQRVLKDNGILAVAYINKHFALTSVTMRDKSFLKKGIVEKLLNNGSLKSGDEACFWTDSYYTTPEEMAMLLKNMNFNVIDHVATDGLSPLLRNSLDTMDDEEYNIWLDYHLKSCRQKSILGFSNHGLIICEKNK